ncbi:MAG: hypothetical protein HUU26_02880 [Gemmatimonadaceae bacterium]|nr:hypothetical protein [Gemmatimonadaceae bacterium]
MRSPFAVLLILVCASPVRGEAQATLRPGDGVAVTVGLSRGAGALTCPFCTGKGERGLAGMLGIDAPFRSRLRRALEANWWWHSSDGASRTVLALMPAIQLYPAGDAGFILKAGLGIGRYAASSDEEELRTTALTSMVGLGYRIPLAGRNVVVPYASWLTGSGGAMRLNGALVTPFGGMTLLQYGLAWTRR